MGKVLTIDPMPANIELSGLEVSLVNAMNREQVPANIHAFLFLSSQQRTR
jgi:hypothetical protein